MAPPGRTQEVPGNTEKLGAYFSRVKGIKDRKENGHFERVLIHSRGNLKSGLEASFNFVTLIVPGEDVTNKVQGYLVYENILKSL